MKNKLTVTVLGASAKPDRYSYQCVELLLQNNHNVIAVTPAKRKICGIKPVTDLNAIDDDIDILTMYVNSARSSAMESDIITLNPNKIIFNPGSENQDLAEKCQKNGIETENACTLVLLNTGQFNL